MKHKKAINSLLNSKNFINSLTETPIYMNIKKSWKHEVGLTTQKIVNKVLLFKYKFVFKTSYLVIIPILFFIVSLMGITSYVYLNYNHFNKKQVKPTYNVYVANPKNISTYSVEAKTTDARAEKVRLFFSKYGAPLQEYADFIVQTADKYGIDWRLVSAIGYCEGNGGKKIPKDSYNTWGWAASEYDLANKTGKYRLGSWETAIETVTKGLKKYYIDQGLDTPEKIMPKYAPPSVKNGGSWARCVNYYLKEIQNMQTPE